MADFSFGDMLNTHPNGYYFQDPAEQRTGSGGAGRGYVAPHEIEGFDASDLLRPSSPSSMGTNPFFTKTDYNSSAFPPLGDFQSWLTEMDSSAANLSPRLRPGNTTTATTGYPPPPPFQPLPEPRRKATTVTKKDSAEKKSPVEESNKKKDEKEKHKVRQRQRRQKMASTMDRLKSMIPQCVLRESEGNKKVDQTQLLEMTVDYIGQLENSLAELQYENSILRACVHRGSPTRDSESSSSGSDTSNSNSSSLASSPNSNPSPTLTPSYFDLGLDNAHSSFLDSTPSPTEPTEPMTAPRSHLHKRTFSQASDGSIDVQLETKRSRQQGFVKVSRALMAIFVVGLIFYNPVAYPHVPSLASQATGRVLQSSVLLQSPTISSSWVMYTALSLFTKLMMLMFWTFGAMLLDHVHVPTPSAVQMAKRENDLGVKCYDRGDFQRSRRHFERALIFLGRSPRPSLVERIFHLPLEMWRQVLHLARIGLWCDGFLVHLQGRQGSTLEVARSMHYLFTLNLLANTIDGHTVLYFLVSLNSAESLYQKPPVLAEVYATVALAFIGFLRMPKAYQYLMGKAWSIMDDCHAEKNEDGPSNVENTRAYLLFLSSYGQLCDGNLTQVQKQLENGCDVFLKMGKHNMFMAGQFFLAYTHFLRGSYTDTLRVMQRIDVCDLGDPRVSWWRELFLVVCNMYLTDQVTEEELHRLEGLYSKVESHSTFAPPLAVVHMSVCAVVLLRLGRRERALAMALEALDGFDSSLFSGWIFCCSFFLSEVFFTLWEDECKSNDDESLQEEQLRRTASQMCDHMRKISQNCEFARPAAYYLLGRYTLNVGEYERSLSYLDQACEAAAEYEMESYHTRATLLIDRAVREAELAVEDDTSSFSCV